MRRRLKCLLLPVLLIATTITIVVTLALQVASSNYRAASNREIARLVGAVIQADPDVDTREIIRALKNSDTAAEADGRQILQNYGYLPEDLVAPSAQHFLAQVVVIIFCGIGGFAAFVLAYFWYRDYREERQIKRLVTYLQELKDRIYDLKLEENSEDELSLLTNEIYKITVLLKEAAENNRSRSQNLETALADISHQLRTPLTSLQVTIDNIYDDPAMPLVVRQDFLRSASRQVESMSSLVMTLLNLAKLDNRSIKFHDVSVRIGELLMEVSQTLSVLSELDEVAIELSGALSAEVKLDRRWQHEALVNIVKNCIEHSPRGSKITINVVDSPLFLKITIQDYGEGIANSDLHHIFERFYKAQNASSESVGIGLSFAKTVIEADRGQISVKSEPGVGTTFTVRYFK